MSRMPMILRIGAAALALLGASLSGCADSQASDGAQAAQDGLPLDGYVRVASSLGQEPPGTYFLKDGEGGAIWFGKLKLGYAYLSTGRLSVILMAPPGDTGKLLLAAAPGDAKAMLASAQATREATPYACISTGWTPAEQAGITHALGSLPPPCPATVAYNIATRHLVLRAVSLHKLTAPDQTLTLSTNATWVDPDFSSSPTADAPLQVSSAFVP